MNFCTDLKNALSSFWENKKFSHEVIMVESKNIQVHIRSSRAGVGLVWRRQRESAKKKEGVERGGEENLSSDSLANACSGLDRIKDGS